MWMVLQNTAQAPIAQAAVLRFIAAVPARAVLDIETPRISDPAVMQALIAAVHRGVAVSAVVGVQPGSTNPQDLGNDPYYASEKGWYDPLMQAGVRIMANPHYNELGATHVHPDLAAQDTFLADDGQAVILTQPLSSKGLSAPQKLVYTTSRRVAGALQKILLADHTSTLAGRGVRKVLVVSPNAGVDIARWIDHAPRTQPIYWETSALRARNPVYDALLHQAAHLTLAVPSGWLGNAAIQKLQAAGALVRSAPAHWSGTWACQAHRCFLGSQRTTAQSLDRDRNVGVFVSRSAAGDIVQVPQ